MASFVIGILSKRETSARPCSLHDSWWFTSASACSLCCLSALSFVSLARLSPFSAAAALRPQAVASARIALCSTCESSLAAHSATTKAKMTALSFSFSVFRVLSLSISAWINCSLCVCASEL